MSFDGTKLVHRYLQLPPFCSKIKMLSVTEKLNNVLENATGCREIIKLYSGMY